MVGRRLVALLKETLDEMFHQRSPGQMCTAESWPNLTVYVDKFQQLNNSKVRLCTQ